MHYLKNIANLCLNKLFLYKIYIQKSTNPILNITTTRFNLLTKANLNIFILCFNTLATLHSFSAEIKT